MKRLFIISFIVSAMITSVFAQTGYDLYKMKSIAQADLVLNALNSELKLSATQLADVRELLYVSVKNQEELLQKPENMSAEAIQGVMIRQTGHIEGNLQELLGADKFKLYQNYIEAIKQKVQAAESTK